MQERILIEIALDSGTVYFSEEDMLFPLSAPVQYEGLIQDPGSIIKSLTDIYSGSARLSSFNFTLSNVENEIDKLNLTEEFRKKIVTLKKINIDTDSVSETYTFTIKNVKIKNDVAVFSCEERELTVAIENFPRNKITLDLFPNIPNGSNALSAGINTWFGFCYNIPAFYISENLGTDTYIYLIGYGDIHSIVNVYRDGVLVSPSQYVLLNFGGYALIVFNQIQKDYQGGYYNITLDIKGIKLDGTFKDNAARCFQEYLTNAVWGWGGTVDSTFFNAAITVCDNLALKAGGGIAGEKNGEAWKNEFLKICLGGIFTTGVNGYELVIPENFISTSEASFDKHNMEVIDDYKTDEDKFVKDVNVDYWFDVSQNKFLKNNEKSVSGVGFGTKKDFKLYLTNDDLTASRIAQRLRNKFEYQDRRLVIEPGIDGSPLNDGSIVDITLPVKNLNAAFFEVERASKKGHVYSITAKAYSENIFDHVTEIYQPSPPAGPGLSAPDDITDLVITPKFEIQPDGTVLSWFLVSYTAPTFNFLHVIISLKLNGSSVWEDVGQSDDGEFKLSPVKAGLSYDLRLVSINSATLKSTPGVVSLNNIAAGDSTAPGVPAGFTANDDVTRTKLDWNDNTDDDFNHYNVYRNSVKIAETKSSLFFDNPPLYNTNYGYQVSAVDHTGNESTKTASDNAKKIPVNGADIDITVGDITIAYLSDIKFTNVANIFSTNAARDMLRIVPTATASKDMTIGESPLRWYDLLLRASHNVSIDSSTAVYVYGTTRVDIQTGGLLTLNGNQLGFFTSGFGATKQTITLTATGGAPLLYNQTWGNQVEASLAAIKAALVAYTLVN